MADYRRCFQPGGCYFFTVVTEGRRPLLVAHIDALRRALRMGMARRPFQIDALVVLPDHLHTIWRLPEGDADFSTRWMHIKRCFSTALDSQPTSPSRQRCRETGVWQRRFWEHLIRDERDWRRHMDYVHGNPVKHGYCAAPRDWPYSSFRRCVRAGLYGPDWGGEAPEDLGWDS
ncbi:MULTISPECIES: transposase [Marichromatium]|uniref:Putative transposase n=1 Tax=Marichromatium gracile TaxID=1048 RepID=A0A4V2W9N2_MARGR|nr:MULTISPECIES: transposase [Marichromatium]MBK1709180.1 transposase [Marichromatium gracile]RNE90424.1 transposase [Marichromatium sp. AB31]TCW35980.1 putative transposase [Marichromatium gracile]